MEQDKHINTGNQYLIISLKHTASHEKLMTLWRPLNAGYTMHSGSAGIYDGFQPGYHQSVGNMPILKADADALIKYVKYGAETIQGIPNTLEVRRKLGLKYNRGTLEIISSKTS